MYYALDKEGNTVNADRADEKKNYYCPCCGHKVFPAPLNSKHKLFEHKNACSDTWKYDTSPWAFQMQKYFNAADREVIIRDTDEVHRADVLKDGVVVKFRHEPVTSEQITEEDAFYGKHNLRVVWVFDLRAEYKSGRIYNRNGLGNGIMKMSWRTPVEALASLPAPQLHDKDISVCFVLEDIIGKNGSCRPLVCRVSWSSLDTDDKPDYKYFNLNYDFPIILRPDMDMDVFFYDEKEHKNLLIKRLADEEGITYDKIKFKACGIRKLEEERSRCPKFAEHPEIKKQMLEEEENKRGPRKAKNYFRLEQLRSEEPWIDLAVCDFCESCLLKVCNETAKGHMQVEICCVYPETVKEKLPEEKRKNGHEYPRTASVETTFFDYSDFAAVSDSYDSDPEEYET